MATLSDTDTRSGTALSAEEIADYKQLRELVSPERSLAVIDDFAKWLFAAAAIVGTLGTGFGVSSANDLAGNGKRVLALAVALVGISLALAALVRLPLPITVNRYSDVDLASKVARLVKIRGVILGVAAVLFAIGLILAGLAPLAS